MIMFLQPSNALSPISVTDSGIITFFKDIFSSRFQHIYAGIYSIPSANITSSILSVVPNALPPHKSFVVPLAATVDGMKRLFILVPLINSYPRYSTHSGKFIFSKLLHPQNA